MSREDLIDFYTRMYRASNATLLIVGGRDPQVLELNEEALAMLECEKQLVVVPGATHLFEEPGTLQQVAEHARRWMVEHLDEADATLREPLLCT